MDTFILLEAEYPYLLTTKDGQLFLKKLVLEIEVDTRR